MRKVIKFVGSAAIGKKGISIPEMKARVFASTDPTNKVTVNEKDGSYSLTITHTGDFTLTAEYTATDGNYKTSRPQSVKTTAPTLMKDISLRYAHTTEIKIEVSLRPGIFAKGKVIHGATVVVEVEGREVARGITSGTPTPQCIFTIDHPGKISKITASYPGYKSAVQKNSLVGNRNTHSVLLDLIKLP